MGFHAYRPVLSGHLEKTSSPFPPDQWITDARRSVDEAQNRYSRLPIFVLGYSLGGALATIIASESNSSTTPTAMILIAPAISLRWPLDVLEAINILPRSTLGFPSLTPIDYQRFSTTPLFWYSNTLEIYSRMNSLSGVERLKQTPTLILLNSSDELVSSNGVIEWVEEQDLAATWSAQEIVTQPKRRGLPAHLFIDRQTAGDAGWSSMIDSIASFIRKNR
jgi:esterase/lipase